MDHLPDPASAASRRARHDGWSPDIQAAFLRALAHGGCVAEAAASVGRSTQSAYRLRADPRAAAFRSGWEQCLDLGVERLADAVYARALHGVAHPVFYQGEQIGERRRYDERLAIFLLRYRRPERYGAGLDRMIAERDPDGPARALDACLDRIAAGDGFAAADGPPPSPPADVAPMAVAPATMPVPAFVPASVPAPIPVLAPAPAPVPAPSPVPAQGAADAPHAAYAAVPTPAAGASAADAGSPTFRPPGLVAADARVDTAETEDERRRKEHRETGEQLAAFMTKTAAWIAAREAADAIGAPLPPMPAFREPGDPPPEDGPFKRELARKLTEMRERIAAAEMKPARRAELACVDGADDREPDALRPCEDAPDADEEDTFGDDVPSLSSPFAARLSGPSRGSTRQARALTPP